ncbi:MAG: hypothetical protein JWO02_2617 [Solirubrobacterales bacterium]|nr:hypothetical protein [Solirubrobacterales bacterium]
MPQIPHIQPMNGHEMSSLARCAWCPTTRKFASRPGVLELMDASQILHSLRRRWPLTGAVVVLAALAGLLAGYHVSVTPLKLTTRTVSSGEATAQILVDAPISTLANLKQDTLPLTTRAGVFAQFMASSTVLDGIARSLSLPPAAVTTEGPFSGPGQAYNTVTPAAARELQLLDERKRYRLQFIAQPDLPLVTVYAHGPDAAAAARLADAVFGAAKQALLTYADLSNDPQARRRVIVRSLGAAQTTTVTSGGGKTVMALAFGAVLLLGWGLIAVMGGPRGRDERPQTASSHVWHPAPLAISTPSEQLRVAQLYTNHMDVDTAPPEADDERRLGRVGPTAS